MWNIEDLFRILDEDSHWKEPALKNIEKLTLTLIDSIMKRDPSGTNIWLFKSTNPWILLYRVSMKSVLSLSLLSSISLFLDVIRKRTNNFSSPTFERFTNSSESKFDFPRSRISSLLNRRYENCLIDHGGLLEYFLLELIQIEHPDIRKRFSSHTIIDHQSTEISEESNEQKSKLSKVIDEIEQGIYCLYGLVLRKSKMKYLNDHNCRSVLICN